MLDRCCPPPRRSRLLLSLTLLLPWSATSCKDTEPNRPAVATTPSAELWAPVDRPHPTGMQTSGTQTSGTNRSAEAAASLADTPTMRPTTAELSEPRSNERSQRPAARTLPNSANASATAPVASLDAAPQPQKQFLTSGVQSGEGYQVYLTTKSPIAVGESVEVGIYLEPLPPFKCNDKYPYRFTVTGNQGVAVPQMAVTTAAVTAAKTSLRLTVVGQSPGRGSVAGTFSFSVCTAEKCLVERVPMVLSFEVVANAVSAPPGP